MYRIGTRSRAIIFKTHKDKTGTENYKERQRLILAVMEKCTNMKKLVRKINKVTF